MTKYIPEENANKIRTLINVCKSIHPKISFQVYDSDDLIYKSKTPDAELILNEMDGGDEEIGINCYLNDKNIGWFGLLPYEDEDSVIVNASDNDFCSLVCHLIENYGQETIEETPTKKNMDEKNYQLNNIHLTENEIEVLKAATCEYGTFDGGFTYEIQIYNYANLGSNASKGALSSLVKKGILNHKRVREDGVLWNYYYGTDGYVEELNEKFGK